MNHNDRVLDPAKMPAHIAIIMDGNGRWAQKQGHERTFGHQNGVEAVRSVIEGAGEMGVRYLTLYAFSTENWNRPKEEVEMLMGLLVKSIHNELDKLMKNQVRLMMTGRMEDLPESCRAALQEAIDRTAANKGLTVVLALSYSGRAEIVDMARNIARQAAAGTLAPEQITPETVQQQPSSSSCPRCGPTSARLTCAKSCSISSAVNAAMEKRGNRSENNDIFTIFAALFL